MKDLDNEKKLAAKEAVRYLKDNQIVGLGSGSSAVYAILEIGELVKNGLKITGVSTSSTSEELARSLGIPTVDISSVSYIDVTIDGADEFTSDLYLIKGGGAALLKEKVVASLTKEEIIITDSSKKVELLGKFTIPIEVIKYAAKYVMSQITQLGGKGELRLLENEPLLTEEGNYIIDADFGLIADPAYLATRLSEIAGVVEHGLFINLAAIVIMGNNDSTITFSKTDI